MTAVARIRLGTQLHNLTFTKILCRVPPTYSCGPHVSSIQLSKDMFKMKDTTIIYQGVIV